MIYQMKISLQGIEPPVWRRIQVDSDITFAELHSIIQVAFEWLNYHLHEFHLKIPGEPLKRQDGTKDMDQAYFSPDYLAIAPPHEDDGDFGPPPLDEHEQVIKDYLKEKRDECMYIYDFGDDWVHEILLEKISSSEQGVIYPNCVKAMSVAPEEDGRGELLSGETVIETGNSEALTKEINERFKKNFHIE